MKNNTEMTLSLNDGKSEIKALQEPIEILAWSWGLSNSKDYRYKDASTTNVQNISMTKYLGNNTPHLMKILDDAVNFKSIVLKAENEHSIIKMTFKDAYLTSLSMGGSGGEDRLTENFTFGFESVEFEFTGKENGKNLGTDKAGIELKARN